MRFQRSLDPTKTLRRRITLAHMAIADAQRHHDAYAEGVARQRLAVLEAKLAELGAA